MLSILLPILIGAVIIAFIIGKPYWREFKRKRMNRVPFPKAWRKVLQQRMPYFRKMPADLQLQLKQHIQVFLSEKNFVGCNGVVITDEIRVTIAAQACLLLLNRKTDYYPKLRTILVYPSAFAKQQQSRSSDGVHFTQNVAMSGESWGFGKIVLSWQDTLDGAYLPNDGHNVVIHEFAHQLDQEDGLADGAPILGKDQSYASWADVFSAQFEQLKHHAKTGTHSIFDYYGATNPAEFFAVASEVFFEKSKQLKHEHPKLYQQLRLFYRVDPSLW
ncbi:zinc-dependent peptidase [Aliiglaciecola sp. 2_MG-2023]|uniref:M90 family metallopeptidase n=1 Tax=unclassified Aliiglaciecola TaxID=2593648 RepID=UPI0026E4023D|nr:MULTISPECIES: M90 family metallopeptidase [unclassified Aliiglaciecola]MDO6710877.1 zinc-dependent peptidase [Aliiglaciecola sp. 2_MG-2023]MDO6752358.1 zinc-dependent peptidase [Aliiglaciecola sp. 1_MG-2023]